MNRIPIHYSNLESYGYDRQTNTFEIAMYGGQLYEYYPVPVEVHQGFVETISKGFYFEKNIPDRYGSGSSQKRGRIIT
jgi:hypothetical protein